MEAQNLENMHLRNMPVEATSKVGRRRACGSPPRRRPPGGCPRPAGGAEGRRNVPRHFAAQRQHRDGDVGPLQGAVPNHGAVSAGGACCGGSGCRQREQRGQRGNPGGRDASLLHPPLSQTDRAGTVQLEKCQRRFHGAAATALEGAVADADRCVPAAAWVGRGAGWGQPERLRPGFADVLLPPLPHTHTSSTARRL